MVCSDPTFWAKPTSPHHLPRVHFARAHAWAWHAGSAVTLQSETSTFFAHAQRLSRVAVPPASYSTHSFYVCFYPCAVYLGLFWPLAASTVLALVNYRIKCRMHSCHGHVRRISATTAKEIYAVCIKSFSRATYMIGNLTAIGGPFYLYMMGALGSVVLFLCALCGASVRARGVWYVNSGSSELREADTPALTCPCPWPIGEWQFDLPPK